MKQTRQSGELSAIDFLDKQTRVILTLAVTTSILSGILNAVHAKLPTLLVAALLLAAMLSAVVVFDGKSRGWKVSR